MTETKQDQPAREDSEDLVVRAWQVSMIAAQFFTVGRQAPVSLWGRIDESDREAWRAKTREVLHSAGLKTESEDAGEVSR